MENVKSGSAETSVDVNIPHYQQKAYTLSIIIEKQLPPCYLIACDQKKGRMSRSTKCCEDLVSEEEDGLAKTSCLFD